MKLALPETIEHLQDRRSMCTVAEATIISWVWRYQGVPTAGMPLVRPARRRGRGSHWQVDGWERDPRTWGGH
jgi:hypothetical protein